MATTFQDIANLARRPLKDAAKRRISDADLLKYLVGAVERAQALRPDLFLGHYADAEADYLLSSTFPLPRRYHQAVANYATAAAESEEDDDTHMERASLFLGLFERELTQ